MAKRYALVRVDNCCPALVDDFGCIPARKILNCKCGEDTKNYGDTKEQLVRKVQTAMKRLNYLPRENFLPKEEAGRDLTEKDYAKFIVEFLGVK